MTLAPNRFLNGEQHDNDVLQTKSTLDRLGASKLVIESRSLVEPVRGCLTAQDFSIPIS